MTIDPALRQALESCGPVAVACSGGVDSMTLAFAAHRVLGARAGVFHAASPAVPEAATARVRAYAAREGWGLTVLDAGEFADENYMANPANRCFFCKTNLYGTLAEAAGGAQLVSGTNLDDLGDWRPGLKAAEAHEVRHPFVEAGMTKADVRALAAALGLEDIAEMPSAPCLSSRVETGIRIDEKSLRAIDRVEVLLRARLAPETVRCRVRAEGVVVELDVATLEGLSAAARNELAASVSAAFAHIPGARVSYQPYTRGSAFLKETLR